MSEFKGTKGKWELTHTLAKREDNITPLYYTINVNGLSFLSTIKNEYLGISDEEQFANAKLISCAPEFLNMLQQVVDLQKTHYGNGSATHIALINKTKEIKELIKKATEL